MKSTPNAKPKLRQSQGRAATPASRNLEIPSSIEKGLKVRAQSAQGIRVLGYSGF